MAFKDMFSKKYKANVWCNNCNTHSEVSVPKGVTLNQFADGGSCPNCGCSTLVVDYRQIDEFKDQPKPQVKLLRIGRRQDIEPPKRALVPPQRPSNRPANSLPPKREAVPEPDFTPKGIFKNDVDFWTGKSKRRDDYENY
jgi:hypothetical protein